MSRRKQVKPQHINLEEDQGEQQPQQLALKFADAAPVVSMVREPGAPMNNPGTGEDMNGDQGKVKRPCLEQTHICEICCGVFFSLSTFLEHKKNCTKSLPVFIMNDSEGLVPSEDFRTVESYQPHNPSSKESPREHGVSSWDMKEKPGAESVLPLKMKTALPPTSQDLSYLPKGKVANTDVTLQALPGTKVAVGQQRPASLPAPLPAANSIPWFLEQVLYLQQQQLQQVQFTKQVCIWMSMWATYILHSGMVGADTLKTLGSHVSQQVQGPSLDPLKQASPPHTNIPPTTSSVPPGLVFIAPRPDGSRVLPNHLPGALIPQAPGSVPSQSPFSTVALDPSTNGKGRPSSVPPVYVKPKDKAGIYMYKCWSSLPSTVAKAQPTYIKVEVPGAFGPTTISPGMASSLAAQPCQQNKQHGHTQFRKNSLASAVQIHQWTHTGEKKLFMCNICRQAFITKDNLEAHYMTHGANNSSAHCGRKQGIENTMVLLGTDGKRLPVMFPQETMVPSVNVDPVVCNQYTTMLSGGLANNTNNSSVIQSVDLSTLLVSQGASSAVGNTTVSKIDGSQSALSADVEKPGAADSIPKHQSPHLLEAKLQGSPPGEM
ncbi:sal-like protein 4 isoform X2 [Myotis daubentonii]|uniref:sal-like protein 4 isoform X2 n=1 Tax=Myotis daubentonii TaxID=98922 RepID=UPI002872ECC5|nr:sal-like protein 4 isoform X2 [Myotis daubentonii]